MENKKKMEEIDYRNDIKKKTSTSSASSFIFALLGIYIAIQAFFSFYAEHGGNMWWKMSIILSIVIFAFPISVLAVVMGVKGLKNPYKWMAISGLVMGILSILIEIITFVMCCG